MTEFYGSIAAINKRLDKLQSLISNMATGKGQGDTRKTEDRAERRGDGGTVREVNKKDCLLKQDFNTWMRRPSLRKRHLISVGSRRVSFGFQKRNCWQGSSCQYTHMCAGCGSGKPFNDCDCVKGNQIR